MPEQKIQTIAKIEYVDGWLNGAVARYWGGDEKNIAAQLQWKLQNREADASELREISSVFFFVKEYAALIFFASTFALLGELLMVGVDVRLLWKVALPVGPFILFALTYTRTPRQRQQQQRKIDGECNQTRTALEQCNARIAADAANPLYRYADAVDRATKQLHALLERWNSYVMRRDLGLAERNPDEEKIMRTLLAAREDMERRVRRVEYLLTSRDATPQQPTNFLASLEDVRAAERDLCDTTVTETYRVAPLSGQRVDLSALQLRLGGDPSSDADPVASNLSLEQAEADALAAMTPARHHS